MVLTCPCKRVARTEREIHFKPGMLQATNTKVRKEHESSSTRGNSRSAKTKLAHSVNIENKKNQRRRMNSNLAADKISTCNFQLRIILSTNGKWYLKDVEKSRLCHTNHIPVACTDIVTKKNSIKKEIRRDIDHLIESGASNNVIMNQVRSKFDLLLTYSLIRELRSDRIDAIFDVDNVEMRNKSSIDRLLRMFEAMNNVSYVYVKHNVTNGFVTYHGDNAKKSQFDDGIEKEKSEWRMNLKISGTEDILVSFAWSRDIEKRQMIMFPEYLGVDMTFGLNREKRNLLTFVGIDGNNQSFTGCRCWMPSKQTVAYQWAVDVALPILMGKKGEIVVHN